MLIHTFENQTKNMKLFTALAALGIGAISVAFTPITKYSTLTIKPEASTIEWMAEKVTGSHEGTIALKEGKIELADDQLIGGAFTVDMTSINVTDLEGDMKGKLEGHLNSEDFFNTAEHQTATFKINKVESIDDETFNTQITGDLTIKGMTHEISFPAKIEVKDNKFAAYGEMTVDRTKYNVKYGSSSFFDNLGDRASYDEFKLNISLGASL